MPGSDHDVTQPDDTTSDEDSIGQPAAGDSDTRALSARASSAGAPPAVSGGRRRWWRRHEQQSDQTTVGTLRSLTSRYQADQHETYLRHLEAAVADHRNLNIALTGRYGTGKSSVLDGFEDRHRDRTTRLAIATLGLEPQDKTLTNKIEKALVKQLLYRASPRELPSSRFSRITPLSRRRATLEAFLLCAALAALLAMFGWLPAVRGTGHDHKLLTQIACWAVTGVVLVAVVTTARLLLHDRFDVSDVAAAGTAVKLTRRTSTYFDEYLDEIVYFFDVVAPDYVIFEDLDRFNDPGIFQALRELNALLNNTATRRKGRPLRFIYAIKDSLFEKLETARAAAPDDAVAAAPFDAAEAQTERANRTKFFDIVIPVVPFISHRNARELLARQLHDAGIDVVDRELVSLVARHATDMRLLINICNEYQVFAEKLLAGPQRAPGLVGSKLFALVVYKNFHLRDFEHIARRSSALDVLFDQRRALVRRSIEQCERSRRDVTSGRTRAQSLDRMAERLGQRLRPLAEAFGTSAPNRLPVRFDINGERHGMEDVETLEFWRAVSDAGQLSVVAPARPAYGTDIALSLGAEQLAALFVEARDSGNWEARDDDGDRAQVAKLDADIRFLRGADFSDLARDERFTTEAHKTFSQIIDETVTSRVGRDLVKQGYIDVNFAVYAAQFYGEFTGIDVMNYIVQSVQPNTMLVDYAFDRPASVANLLQEVGPDFTRTVSAFNIDVIDYLLEHDDNRASQTISHLTATLDHDARTFLNAYFNSGARRDELAARLAREPWPEIFEYLVTDEELPDDVRPDLVGASLIAAAGGVDYRLGPAVRDFLVANYHDMSAFTAAHDEPTASKVAAFTRACGAVLPDMTPLDGQVRREITRAQLFAITGPNLRLALGTTGAVSFDEVSQDEYVYAYCRRSPDPYLRAVEYDDRTPYAVRSASTLSSVLNEVAEHWDEQQLQHLLRLSSPQSKVTDLGEVPTTTWPLLAAAQRFMPTLSNVDLYREHVGKIDRALADVLVAAGRIDAGDADQDKRAAAAVAILGAIDVLASPQMRVDLAASLDLNEHLPVEELPAEPAELLALLLDRGLVADAAETFAHYRSAGWAAFETALAHSSNFVQFMTAELLEGMIGPLLRSSAVPDALQQHVVDHLDSLVPTGDADALLAAAEYALARHRPLPPALLRRVAAAVGNIQLIMRSLAMSPPAASEIVKVLSALPQPYSYLTSREKVEFEVPGDPDHRAVFEVLKKANVLSNFRKKGRLSSTYIARLKT